MGVENVASDELCLILDNFRYGPTYEPWFVIPPNVPRVPYNTLIRVSERPVSFNSSINYKCVIVWNAANMADILDDQLVLGLSQDI